MRIKTLEKNMKNTVRIKNICEEIYDPAINAESTIEKYFHPDYEQCINGVILKRREYIQHVIAQRKNIVINHFEYTHHIENKDELFAIYSLKGNNFEGSAIEAEVIAYFQFQEEKIIRIHGQVRLIKGSLSDVDM
jgi:hypothetical protein